MPEVGTVGLVFMRVCMDSSTKSTDKFSTRNRIALYIDVIPGQHPQGIERIEECASSSSAAAPFPTLCVLSLRSSRAAPGLRS